MRVTDQELSRLKKQDWPISLKTDDYESSYTKKKHRSDGYWYYEGSKKLISLEVQISRQKLKDYEEVGHFYFDQTNVETVLWVVERISMSSAIMTAVKRDRWKRYDESENSAKKHNFVCFENFFKNGYDAQIEVGELQGITIHQLLSGNLKTPFPIPKEKAVRKLLDVRKSPHIAKRERFYVPGDVW